MNVGKPVKSFKMLDNFDSFLGLGYGVVAKPVRKHRALASHGTPDRAKHGSPHIYSPVPSSIPIMMFMH